MPLGPADPLPRSTRRIVVAGSSGSGKSTLRARIADVLDVATVEIDALQHGPGWSVRPTFAAEVDAFTAGPAWVIEWQYTAVRELLLERADVLIWLNHGRWTVTQRVVRRTLHRRLRRVELWHGNREPPLWTVFTDRGHIVRWSWSTHRKTERLVRAVITRPGGPVVVRLAGQRAVDAWVAGPLRALADGR